MSEIYEAAKASVILADFASQDNPSKLNLLGAFWNITSIQPTGLTPPQCVVITIEVPARFHGQSFSLSVALNDDTGTPINLPGQTDPLRIAQLVPVQRTVVPGGILPEDLPATVRVVLRFPTGLPLQVGKKYSWQLQLDGNTQEAWRADFYVVGPPPPPVIG